MNANEVIYLPITPERKQALEQNLAYWEHHINVATRALEYAERQREQILRELGRLGIENGLTN